MHMNEFDKANVTIGDNDDLGEDGEDYCVVDLLECCVFLRYSSQNCSGEH